MHIDTVKFEARYCRIEFEVFICLINSIKMILYHMIFNEVLDII